MPAKADPVAQSRFRDGTLSPLLKKAEKGKGKVFFVDAAHFVRGAFLAYLWCFVRWVVPTGAGRQRYSVLAALDATDRTSIRETTVGTVDQTAVARLLVKIRAAHPEGPIRIVWDNARYQHTPVVRATAKLLRIELNYLPPYSPNLNLIERVWKFVKKKALANKSFADFAAFRAAIDSVLDRLGTSYKSEMESLLTPRFETLYPPSIPNG